MLPDFKDGINLCINTFTFLNSLFNTLSHILPIVRPEKLHIPDTLHYAQSLRMALAMYCRVLVLKHGLGDSFLKSSKDFIK